ncbi:hypothetical protein E4T38_00464 [Aureobasidium subglaciale]|nr:hypothetical protein E4T38_00464 [Aureobasidium subglaciale]KAI5231572.1 hypothetical protein E4T40_00440 [Aureobasidium subglaciale]KAI5234469.1 hypothetical protein E4T41_00463 [Aureobasidium subglaciale]KAI5267927.1 hypothetical protein E4T46_00463 [Aureobasidium subglaciale]
MSRSTPPIVFYNPGGVRKRPANQPHRVAIRWIQEYPNQDPAASRGEPSTRVVDDESETNRESKIYRITSTGDRQLRAPLLNAYLLADAPLRLSIGSQRDPFSSLPVPWKPPYGIITSYFKYAIAPAIVAESFEPEGKTRQEALEDIEWPMALSVQTNDPALFFAALAMSCVHLPETHEFSPQSNSFFFRWLSSKCVEYLNKSLSNPSRACSDGTLIAVTFISFCESMAGNHRIAATIHQPGLRQMVNTRGGLDSIAKASAIGERVTKAISALDIVVASKFGCTPIFEDSYALALQDVEMTDIVSRIKKTAEGRLDPASPIPRTVILTQRLKDHDIFQSPSASSPVPSEAATVTSRNFDEIYDARDPF